jgi:phosphate transport system protein
MKHTDLEIQSLKNEVKLMWKLVISQVGKSKKVLLNNDVNAAIEVINSEKRVNAYELKIDSDCENYIALYSPVAVDLRLALSLIKISSTLERIGDFAVSMARSVTDKDFKPIDKSLLTHLKIEKTFDTLLEMLLDAYIAFESENTKVSAKIMAKDNLVDELYHNSFSIVENYIKSNPENTLTGIKTMMTMRKLERIGDHCNNIVEEIVFYVEAKVLKHIGKTAITLNDTEQK